MLHQLCSRLALLIGLLAILVTPAPAQTVAPFAQVASELHEAMPATKVTVEKDLTSMNSFETVAMNTDYTYAHGYDIGYNIRGFNTNLGTLVAIHVDLWVTDPQYLTRYQAPGGTGDCYTHVGYTGCNTTDSHITDTADVYYKISGTEFFMAEGVDVAAPGILTVPANTDFYNQAWFFWGGDTTTVDACTPITDSSVLAAFSGSTSKRIFIRTFQTNQSWVNCCSGMGGGEQNDFNVGVTLRYEYN